MAKSNDQKPDVHATNSARRRRHWSGLAAATLIIVGIAAISWLMRESTPIGSRAAAQTTTPDTQPSFSPEVMAALVAATQAAANQPVIDLAAQASVRAAFRSYHQAQGELSFMQDHLARMQAQGRPDADIQSIQGVINDLQTQVQTAAAATEPAP